MKPSFSIVIPLYNKANFIAETLQSVLQQTIEDFEIIIVNDASTDDSVNRANRIIDNRITVLHHKKNKGLSATRNTGIAYANADWICLLDADDIWENNYLATLSLLIQQFPEASIIGTDYQEKHSNTLTVLPTHTIHQALKNTSFLVKDNFEANMGQPLVCQSSMAFSRKVIADKMVFDENITYSEDIDFYIRNLSQHKVAYHYSPMVTIRVNYENQITNSGIKNKTIPNFSTYKNIITSKSMERYIDFQRYTFVLNYRKEKAFDKANALQEDINFANLNWRQQLLIKLPYFLLKLMTNIKRFLLSKQIRVSSY